MNESLNASVPREILQYISTDKFISHQRDVRSKAVVGTGSWFLQSPEFEQWAHGSGQSQTLFCPGTPGAGKTIMMSTAVDYLWIKNTDNNVGIAYLYFNYMREHVITELFSSLLRQLIERYLALIANATALYETHTQGRPSKPSLDEISDSLVSVIGKLEKTFILVDALDECLVMDGGRQKFLSELFKVQTNTGLRLFATSRYNQDIVQQFNATTRLEIEAKKGDLEKYLDSRMSHLPSCVLNNSDLQREVRNKITLAVDGM